MNETEKTSQCILPPQPVPIPTPDVKNTLIYSLGVITGAALALLLKLANK